MKIHELIAEYGLEGIDLSPFHIEVDQNLSQLTEDKMRSHLEYCKAQISSKKKELSSGALSPESAEFRNFQEKEFAIRKNNFGNFLKKPISEIFARFNSTQLKQKFSEYKVSMSPEIANLITYFQFPYESNSGICYRDVIHPDLVYGLKNTQLREFSHAEEWKYQVARMGFAAEISFEKLCKENNLSCEDLNKKFGIHHSADYSVKNKAIDVKARCKIGRKKIDDSNLSEKNFKENEILAFFMSHEDEFEFPIHCEFIGIYDPFLISEAGFKTEKKPFLNPLHFVDFHKYFVPKNKKPITSKEVSYLQSIGQFSPQRLMTLFDPSSVLSSLVVSGWLKGFEGLTKKYISLTKSGHELLSPLLTYQYLDEVMTSKLDFDIALFKERMLPLLSLSARQYDFTLQYLKVINFLMNTDNKCHSSGIPLRDCKIVFKNAGATIVAVAPESSFENTLLSYSWYDGRIVNVADEEITRHHSATCACLLHNSDDGPKGKLTCSHYGNEAYIKSLNLKAG